MVAHSTLVFASISCYLLNNATSITKATTVTSQYFFLKEAEANMSIDLIYRYVIVSDLLASEERVYCRLDNMIVGIPGFEQKIGSLFDKK